LRHGKERVGRVDTLKPGMKHVLEWVVEERMCTTRGEYKVFDEVEQVGEAEH
jgi:hypothetical protein